MRNLGKQFHQLHGIFFCVLVQRPAMKTTVCITTCFTQDHIMPELSLVVNRCPLVLLSHKVQFQEFFLSWSSFQAISNWQSLRQHSILEKKTENKQNSKTSEKRPDFHISILVEPQHTGKPTGQLDEMSTYGWFVQGEGDAGVIVTGGCEAKSSDPKWSYQVNPDPKTSNDLNHNPSLPTPLQKCFFFPL